MTAKEIIILVVLILLFGLILPMLFIQYFVARHIYKRYFVRNDKDNWTREKLPTEPDEEIMYQEGKTFGVLNSKYKQDVTITSEGFKLMGEYYDFGFNKAVIIVGGRSEALTYCYYYAIPYKEAGFNVLVIDNRSHGLSEGKYNSLGLKEYKDIIKWVDLLDKTYHNNTIIGHGICIGSATLLYAITNENCSKAFKGLIVDGMYKNFPNMFINHCYYEGHQPHFVAEFIFGMFKRNIKEDIFFGPVNLMNKMDKPILFMSSTEDVFAYTKDTLEMFDNCVSKNKEIKVFNKGSHSHIRVNNKALYDETIIDFVSKNFK